MLRFLYSQHRFRRRGVIPLIYSCISSHQPFIVGSTFEGSFTINFSFAHSLWIPHKRASSTNDQLDIEKAKNKIIKFEKDQDMDGLVIYFDKIRHITTAHHLQVMEILGSNNLQKFKDIILNIFNSLVEKKEATLEAYNTLILVFGLNGDIPFAIETFHSMNEKGIEPKLSTYNSLLRVYARSKKQKEMEELFKEITAKFLPDDKTYLYLARGYMKLNFHTEALHAAIKLESKFKLNEEHYGVLIGAYGKKRGWKAAEIKYEDMKEHGIKASVETYNVLMSVYSQYKLYSKLATCFHQMKKEGLSPNLRTYQILIGVLGKMGDLKEMERLFKEASQKWKPDLSLLNNLAFGYSLAGKVDKLMNVFRSMKDYEITPNYQSYSTVFYAFGRKKNIEQIDKIYNEIQSSTSIQLEQPLYHAAMQAYIQAGDLSKALRVFQEMKNSGCRPLLDQYKLLIQTHLTSGMIEESIKLTEEMEHFNVLVDKDIANDILKELDKQGHPMTRIVELFESFRKRNTHPNITTFHILIQAALSRDLFNVATDLLDDLYGTLGFPEVNIYNLFLNYLGTKGLLDDMEEVYKELREVSIEPSEETFVILFTSFANNEQFSRHFQYLRDISQFRIKSEDVEKLMLMSSLSSINREPPRIWKRKRRYLVQDLKVVE